MPTPHTANHHPFAHTRAHNATDALLALSLAPTPAFAYNAHWQSPIRSNRLISPTMFRQPENDDVIEAEYTEVLPSLPNHSQRQPETPKPPSTRKGGRPKKYASAAERQAAYRARMAA